MKQDRMEHVQQSQEAPVFLRDANTLLDKVKRFNEEQGEVLENLAQQEVFADDDDLQVKSAALESVVELARDLDEALDGLEGNSRSAKLLDVARKACASLESEFAQVEILFAKSE